MFKNDYVPHLSNLDWSASQAGDAWQGTSLTALWVSHHSAISTLQRDFPKLDPLSTRHTRFRLDYLNTRKASFVAIRMTIIRKVTA